MLGKEPLLLLFYKVCLGDFLLFLSFLFLLLENSLLLIDNKFFLP